MDQEVQEQKTMEDIQIVEFQAEGILQLLRCNRELQEPEDILRTG